MDTVIIVIHLMVVVALIAVVLLQRSEGGALGIGGGNAFLSTRGQGNVLTKATAILATVFFLTSITLTVLSRLTAGPGAVLDNVQATPVAPAAGSSTTSPASTPDQGGTILDRLNKSTDNAATPATGDSTTVPAPADSSSTPPTPAPATP